MNKYFGRSVNPEKVGTRGRNKMTTPTHRSRPKTCADKCRFIAEWSDWFYNTTNSFDGALGRSLAYLWPAIVKENQIEVAPQSAIVRHLREQDVPETNIIWRYIDVV